MLIVSCLLSLSAGVVTKQLLIPRTNHCWELWGIGEQAGEKRKRKAPENHESFTFTLEVSQTSELPGATYFQGFGFVFKTPLFLLVH